ncbi:MAG: hypothetical protein JKX85_06455 [Phycisphaeraceae bacterium]|nr:hypothetical protein [Phycisphaeraceae bacterium]
MYELTCPACQHKSEHIFVRIGAKTSCSQCQHRYQLSAEQVQRLIAVPAEDGATPNHLLFGSPVTKPPAPAHPAHGQRQTRRQPEQRPPAADPPLMTPEEDPTLHPQPKPKPPAQVQLMIAQRRAQRERKRMIIRSIIGVLSVCLPVAVLVYMFMMAHKNDDQPLKSDDGMIVFKSAPKSPANDWYNRNLISIKAELLAAPFWRLVDEPYEAFEDRGEIHIQPGTAVSRDEANITYVVSYSIDSPSVLELAILHLSLVDSRNRIFATNQIPLTLLTDSTMGIRSTGTLKIALPRDLASRMSKMVSQTQVLISMDNSIALREPMIESQIEGEHAQLLIAAYNPLDKPLQRCVFSIMAVDKSGEELAHWRVSWQRMLAPRQRVEFLVKLPISKSWAIDGWKLIAFGESVKPNRPQ